MAVETLSKDPEHTVDQMLGSSGDNLVTIRNPVRLPAKPHRPGQVAWEDFRRWLGDGDDSYKALTLRVRYQHAGVSLCSTSL